MHKNASLPVTEPTTLSHPDFAAKPSTCALNRAEAGETYLLAAIFGCRFVGINPIPSLRFRKYGYLTFGKRAF